jgi:hypothetical protein
MQPLHIKFLGSSSTQHLMFLIDLDGLAAVTSPLEDTCLDLVDALVMPLLPLLLLPSPLPLLQETLVTIERTG